jgi:hypothetical protein
MRHTLVLIIFLTLIPLASRLAATTPSTGCGWSETQTSPNTHPERWPVSLKDAPMALDCKLLCTDSCQSRYTDNDLKLYISVITSTVPVAENAEAFAKKFHALTPDDQEILFNALACYHCRTAKPSEFISSARTFLSEAKPYTFHKGMKPIKIMGAGGWLMPSDGQQIKWFRNSKGNFGFVEFADGERIYLKRDTQRE